MPKFTITFEREVVQVDRCTRTIEADSHEAATRKAIEMANEFDHSCPDDATAEGGEDCQEWTFRNPQPAADDAEVDGCDEEGEEA